MCLFGNLSLVSVGNPDPTVTINYNDSSCLETLASYGPVQGSPMMFLHIKGNNFYILVHPNYGHPILDNNDIALVELQRPLTYRFLKLRFFIM